MISRFGQRRRERRANTQPDHPFEVESCEYLTDGAFALVRVTGVGSVAPVALITQGDGPESFDTLPQPGGGARDGAWQIAFALPSDVVEPGSRVWLHDGGLYLADLVIPPPAKPEREPVAEEMPAANVAEASTQAAELREKLADREAELAQALKDLLEARNALEGARADTAAAEEQRAELEEANKSRRTGISRRREDRDARREVAELEAKVAEREQRIAALEAEARQHAASNDELHALLESDRETAAAARREAEDLKQQLASVSAEMNGRAAQPTVKPAASPNGVQSPPWSSVDDELLARIEKAKALTQ